MTPTSNTSTAGKALYAATGAAAWTVDQVCRGADQARRWAQSPHEFADHTSRAYDELAQRGRDALGRGASEARRQADRAAHEARKQPGIAHAEGEITGAVQPAEADLPIADYDALNVAQVTEKLPQLSQRELGIVDGYERRTRARVTILNRIDELRGQEPWPGYDEMTVDEVLPRLRQADTRQRSMVAEYETKHKNRSSVLNQAHRSPDDATSSA